MRVAVLNDLVEVAGLIAADLRAGGHEVLLEIAPIDFERVLQFGPAAIVLVLHRRRAAFNRPIASPSEDIIGYKALSEVESYPALTALPTALIGLGLDESDIPIRLRYDVFLTFPDDAQLYRPKIEELAGRRKGRRKIGWLLCPHCRSRLMYLENPENLFCPRCGAGVSIHEGDCVAMLPDGRTIRCDVAAMRPPPAG
ncbi:MAG: hypothetical protein FJZ01_10295 [Candidatus Sericytochromatia bacterium]|nr:hypothetical protein [Candidatus Tanganyikabacteria bacterium]